MPVCTCFCWKVFMENLSGGPIPTFTFKYKDCETGLDVFVTVPPTTPFVIVCSQGLTGQASSTPSIVSPLPVTPLEFNAIPANSGFKVTNCLDPNDFFFTNTNLGSYSGGAAVKFVEFPGCWTVTFDTVCDSNTLVTLLLPAFADCPTCLAEPEPEPDVILNLISCCGTRVFFQIPASLVGSYGNTNDTYIYTGPPIADVLGSIMYPNQCYYITSKGGPPPVVRPLAPLPALLSPTGTSYPTSCTTDVCSHCYYKLQDCTDPLNILISYSNLAAYLGQTITVQNQPGCWTVSETDLNVPTPIAIVPIQGYGSCPACLTKGIVFTSCCGFSAYFLLDSSIPYLTEGNVYVYNGAPIADGFGNTLYPNICYSYSTFTTLTGTVNAPALASFTTSLGLNCEAAPCKNCFYKLTNCANEAQVIYTYSNLSVVVGDSVTINGYPKICWNVEASTTAVNPIAVTIVATYIDCVTCKGYFFTLNDCCTDEPYLINGQPAVLEYHGNANPDFAPGDIVDLIITTVNLENGTSITGCFKIGELTTPPTTQTIIPWDTNTDFVTVPTCEDCQTCQTCYLLTNCATGLVEYITGTNLIQYIGGVITIAGCKDQCWIVTQAENCDGCGGAVQVLTYFPSVVVTPEMCTYTIALTNFTSITSASITINGTVYPLVVTSVATLISSINALGLGTCYYGGGALSGTLILGLTGDYAYGTLCVFGT